MRQSVFAIGAIILGAALIACQPAPDGSPVDATAVADADLIETGRQIAERNCAVCHAIGPTGTSPRPEAPPLRTALADYDIEAIATDFREHVQLGGEIMPQFDFDPIATDALMAYLLTIEEVSAD
ncbi:MAG: cytochrome c [Pseudomonadota bacterium]